MALSKLFAIRGFLAFVAFMEFVNALRSLLPSLFTLPQERLTESFVHKKIFSQAELTQQTELIISQLFGFYSLLNATVVVHASLFCHYAPVLSLGLVSVACKTLFYMVQGFYHHTIPNTSGLQVPLFISFLSLVGLLLLATSSSHNLLADREVRGDENDELLRSMRFNKSRKKKVL